MYKKNRAEPKIIVNKVYGDKSNIKFSVLLEGEIDWNEFFGMEKAEDSSLCHERSEFRYGDDSFSQSLVNFILRVASYQDDYGLFKKATLTKLEVCKEVEESYQEFRNQVASKEKAKKLDQLKEAEKEVARLKKEVLKEF